MVGLLLASCYSPLSFTTAARCDAEADCPTGHSCVEGECRPCPACGAAEVCLKAQCLPAACGDRPCRQGQACIEGACRGADCLGVRCPAGEGCARGGCYPQDCADQSCDEAEVCWAQECREPACVGVTCGMGEVCAGGRCLPSSCAGVVCGQGAACEDGRCQSVRCVGIVCPAGAVCADGRCVSSVCEGVVCADGYGCLEGRCQDARCAGVVCDPGSRCREGACAACGAYEAHCGNLADEDCDGRTDCADADCLDAACGPGGACGAQSCGPGGECEERLEAIGTPCRPAAGECDVEETCDGTGLQCPTDVFAPLGTECRDATEGCDLAEACDGTGAQCPADGTLCPPPAPVFVSTTPTSPSSSTSPLVKGLSSADTATVELYSDSGCTARIGAGAKAAFEGAGIAATVAANVSTTIYAVALNAAGNGSPCTLLTTYVNFDPEHCVGGCVAPETCSGGGVPAVCGCTPTTCQASGAECGLVPDGCGGTLMCGLCGAPQSCGGGGVPNVCGCTPKSCTEQGKQCGTITDGCGAPLVCPSCADGATCGAESLCGPATNLAIFANYAGGTFTINVDEDLPGLVIGLVSYEAMTVTLTGPYLANVLAVHYAGTNSAPGSTTISGISADKVTIAVSPVATLSDPLGDARIMCQYQGGASYSGGCNTRAQVRHYFASTWGGQVALHRCQYGAYPGTLDLSAGGDCACSPTNTCAIERTSCGTLPDGCGGTLSCGTCPSTQSCGGSGTPNLCGGCPAGQRLAGPRYP
ncbi:MAG: hypothetical protein HY901_25710, partial [Deltaproteobacteria bacterium]|nr:hypothetical protein [Deltaproteobacteria bacterium]